MYIKNKIKSINFYFKLLIIARIMIVNIIYTLCKNELVIHMMEVTSIYSVSWLMILLTCNYAMFLYEITPCITMYGFTHFYANMQL